MQTTSLGKYCASIPKIHVSVSVWVQLLFAGGVMQLATCECAHTNRDPSTPHPRFDFMLSMILSYLSYHDTKLVC